MLPKVIIHNSISLDGSLTNFDPNMGLHYWIAGKYKPDAHLIGSTTIKVGIDLYSDGAQLEGEEDFKKPKREKHLPYWVIPDTNGSLEGLLHTCRSFELCKEVIVLISEETPKKYIQYLKERNYDYHIMGKNHVDLEKSLTLLFEKYKIKTVLTDTGKVLGNLLLNKGLVSEVSLLIHPIVVGNEAYNMFSDVNSDIQLKLKTQETLNDEYVWLTYKVKK